jgi:hydroxyacylglutathione hydrolase
VLFRQFVDDGLGCASYLIGDEEAGLALVVDPAFAIEPYVEAAASAGLRIELVLETHTHADHVSGHGRLALEHGTRVGVHPLGEPAFPFEALEDGAELGLGSLRIRVVHTPGHRPEHCAFVVSETGRPDAPPLLLTGDSLFVGSVGRPDLAVEAREGAVELFSSLQRLLELPDDAPLYPGHVAGSLCGAGLSTRPSSTIGEERATNPALALGSLDEFVAEAIGSAGIRPPHVARVVALNQGPFLAARPPLPMLADAGGATVLDVRPADAFAAGHVPAALNVPVSSSSFATRASFLLGASERVALHADSPEEAAEAARGLRAVGLLDLEGVLEAPATPARLEPVAVDELDALLATGDVRVIDVREAEERDRAYIAGSLHIPYRLLRAGGSDLCAGCGTVVTICETGSRAGIAASVLAAAGVDARPVLDGGVPTWREQGGKTISFRRCGT